MLIEFCIFGKCFNSSIFHEFFLGFGILRMINYLLTYFSVITLKQQQQRKIYNIPSN